MDNLSFGVTMTVVGMGGTFYNHRDYYPVH